MPFRSGLLIVLGALLLGAPCLSMAERFVTWVDEDGEVRHTRVKDPESDKAAANNNSKTTDSTGAVTPSAPAEEQPIAPVKGASESASPPPAKEQDIVKEVEALRETGQLNSVEAHAAAHPDAEISPEAYIDAQQLEQQGFVRDGEQKFYTWIDGEGNLRSAPIGQSEKAVVVFEPKAQKHNVVAREQKLTETLPIVANADPEALKIMGLNGPPKKLRDIDRLAAVCCDQFKEIEPYELRWSDDQVLFFDGSDEMMDFGLGYSYYRMIALPENLPKDALFSIQSFVRRSMFNPVVVTLDEAFKPVRMLTDILYVYEKESWRKHASMEGYFRVPSVEKERFLLVFSRNVDQVSTTVVDGLQDDPILIPHAPKGELYLSVIK